MLNVSILAKKHRLLTVFGGVLAALLSFALILQFINYQKIILGVSVAGQDFSGLTLKEANAKLNDLASEIKRREMTMKYDEHTWRVLLDDLGVDFDIQTALGDISKTGHSRNILADSFAQIKSVLRQKSVSLSPKYDEKKFDDFIQKNLIPLQNPPKNATLIYEQNLNDFSFVPAQDGWVFDPDDFKRQIGKNLSAANNAEITLKQTPVKASLTQDLNGLAASQAKKILELAPYSLKYNGSSWPIEKETLIEWLEFIPAIDNANQTMAPAFSETKIQEFMLQLRPAINREPINAKLTIQDSKVTEFSLSQNGAELQIEKSAKRINQEILGGKKEIALIIKELPALISTTTIDTLGLTELLGAGDSNFAGSPKNRVHNIGIGAVKISGTLVRPGEEFSFNKTIGEISAAQGYKPELVIKNRRTVPEYGGGVCQVSTTLFRAAVNSGLKITKRYPHAFPVKYYNPQGFDATIYPPNPDLRFFNDTPSNILIQSKIEGTKITFEIYGTKDNRETKVLGPTILESKPDGSMKTVLYQEIWRDGILERKDTFRSNYKSPALYPTVKNPLE